MRYTGLARYDVLSSKEKNKKNQILIMPTWRLYLSDCKDISEYDYYKYFNELLNDDKIILMLEKYKYKLYFYPHYEMQKFIDRFQTKRPDIIEIASFNDYDVQSLLIESKILITDFSSVFFDFAYMRKPIIYYQFDEKTYRETQYKEGYFKYKTDGFGKVVHRKKELIEELEKILDNNGKLETKYKERIEKFFGENENQLSNCSKIYNEIEKIL